MDSGIGSCWENLPSMTQQVSRDAKPISYHVVVRAPKCILSPGASPVGSHTPPRLKLQMLCPGMEGSHPTLLSLTV